MTKKVTTARRARAAGAAVTRETAQALYRAASAYRTEVERLKRMRRGSGFDRQWTRVADRARLARSIFLALLAEAGNAPRLAR